LTYEERILAEAQAMAEADGLDFASLPETLKDHPAPWGAVRGDTREDWIGWARAADTTCLKMIGEPTEAMIMKCYSEPLEDSISMTARRYWRAMWEKIPRKP
jgi:hypothetical protein